VGTHEIGEGSDLKCDDLAHEGKSVLSFVFPLPPVPSERNLSHKICTLHRSGTETIVHVNRHWYKGLVQGYDHLGAEEEADREAYGFARILARI